eukprot:CAMPEP_0174286264 /NCGR_PEP_ID=MMETSP0809-20121228/11123_1 /TAXON_ID=73025 ORGANISM="Eutreptiella gymnastica-like, Strain CCMP1594" /NCGR_SAMPLE_ID=MMETSP0809 /ASSEMBLY_ACC=CAM_ASM_000658 /LENGTH=85 /DNA_ID=CAMNT_0015382263 /DNA_START=756 /DNA_END=1013 /DNA_ORIENTATION=+
MGCTTDSVDTLRQQKQCTPEFSWKATVHCKTLTASNSAHQTPPRGSLLTGSEGGPLACIAVQTAREWCTHDADTPSRASSGGREH